MKKLIHKAGKNAGREYISIDAAELENHVDKAVAQAFAKCRELHKARAAANAVLFAAIGKACALPATHTFEGKFNFAGGVNLDVVKIAQAAASSNVSLVDWLKTQTA